MDNLVDPFSIERDLHQQGYDFVAGVDEAGRGPLAGPVVAACVVLPVDCDYRIFRDSKKLTPAARERLFQTLHTIGARIGVGSVSERGIDRHNILQASLLAMRQAVKILPSSPSYLLVDGKFPVPCSLPQQALVKGESRSASIAAASIVAKVVRDRMMKCYHAIFPQYNFCKHKGYPTVDHKQRIVKYGPCIIHRRAFRGVREHL